MISVIIPALNEGESIGPLILFLLKNGNSDLKEVIVSDGGSTDDTIEKAFTAGAIVVQSPQRGRAAQMNFGASKASAEILYFVHADTYPPVSFTKDIQRAVREGFGFGRFRTRFDTKTPILKMNAWFTRFDLFICYGGDQTLFITTGLFEKIYGFSGEMKIMEDYDIVKRAKQAGRYKIIQKDVLVSARKYLTNSWLRVQLANYRIVRMYKKGASQTEMTEKYKQLLNYR
jgi:rSAM/selenodomain-associated transferase 2